MDLCLIQGGDIDWLNNRVKRKSYFNTCHNFQSMPLNDTSRKWQLKRDQLPSLPNFKKRQIRLLRPRVSSSKSYEHDSHAKVDVWLQVETGYSATWTKKNPGPTRLSIVSSLMLQGKCWGIAYHIKYAFWDGNFPDIKHKCTRWYSSNGAG